MKILFFCITVFILCVQCTAPQKDTLKRISFAEGIEHIREVNVSEIASGIRFIPLETTQDCLLGRDLYDIAFCGEYLFVRGDFQLYQFTPEGKFIRQIGKEGQGPAEYLKIGSVKYDTEKREIYVNDLLANKIKVYSFEGTFLRDIPTGDGELLIHYDVNNKLFYTCPMFFFHQQEANELIVYNEKGEELYTFPFQRNKDIQYPGFIFTNTIMYTYAEKLYSKNPLELTVFQLNGHEKKPAYQLDLGRYEKLNWVDDMVIKKEGNMGFGEVNKEAEDKISFYDIFELPNYICFHYLQRQRSFAWYDKVENKVSRIRGKNATIDGFTDDLQNGCPILPRFYTGNQIIGYVSAVNLLEELKDKDNLGEPLKQVIDKLVEDDNPVLQVVVLKK